MKFFGGPVFVILISREPHCSFVLNTPLQVPGIKTSMFFAPKKFKYYFYYYEYLWKKIIVID